MTLFLGLLALIVIHCNWNLFLRLTAVAALMAVSHLINCDWAVSGIMIIRLSLPVKPSRISAENRKKSEQHTLFPTKKC